MRLVKHLDCLLADITDDGVSTVLAYCGELQELNLAGNKRLTILPFLPIIAGKWPAGKRLTILPFLPIIAGKWPAGQLAEEQCKTNNGSTVKGRINQ